MLARLRKHILYFNDECRIFFEHLEFTEEYPREQFIQDVVTLVNETKEAERGFLLNVLLERIAEATDRELEILSGISLESLDIPTKSAAVLFYHRFFPEKLDSIVEKSPPVRYLSKEAKILSIPHFQSVRLFISAFTGETEIDVLVPLFERLLYLRNRLIAEYTLAVLRDIVVEHNSSASCLTEMDATVYDMTSEELFVWFYEYFPLNTDNQELEALISKCIAVPGSSFDFYELLLERVRDSSAKDVPRLASAWEASVERTRALRELQSEKCNLQEMYAELCQMLDVQPMTLNPNFSDMPVDFDAEHIFELLSNDPQAYSSDLFDVISTQILFGIPEHLQLMRILVESGDGISGKIDEIVQRELKFDSEAEIKRAALEILLCGSEIGYEESIVDVMALVTDFSTPAELLYAETVMQCFRLYKERGIDAREMGVSAFCTRVLANENRLDVREIVYLLQLVRNDESVAKIMEKAQCPAVRRLLFYWGGIADSMAFPSTTSLIESFYFDDHIEGCYLVDYVADRLSREQFSQDFIIRANQAENQFQAYLKEISLCLPVDYLLNAFSDERFEDAAIASVVDCFGDCLIAESRIAAIGPVYSRTRITLMHKHGISIGNADPYTVFVLFGLRGEHVTDDVIGMMIEQLHIMDPQPSLFAVPKLTLPETEEIIEHLDTNNECLVLLASDFQQQELDTEFLDEITAKQLNSELSQALIRLVASNKLNVTKLADICLEGIMQEAPAVAMECLSLVSELPPHSVEEDTRRRVYMGCQQYLEAADSEVRNRARRVRVCWML